MGDLRPSEERRARGAGAGVSARALPGGPSSPAAVPTANRCAPGTLAAGPRQAWGAGFWGAAHGCAPGRPAPTMPAPTFMSKVHPLISWERTTSATQGEVMEAGGGRSSVQACSGSATCVAQPGGRDRWAGCKAGCQSRAVEGYSSPQSSAGRGWQGMAAQQPALLLTRSRPWMPSWGISGPKSAGRSGKPVEKLFACQGGGGRNVHLGWGEGWGAGRRQPARTRPASGRPGA